MTSPRTILTAWNLRAKKKFGQNFLKDPSTAEMIVRKSCLSENDIVLEIGPGLGSMTIPMAKTVDRVFAVDKDIRLEKALRSELLAAGIHNVDIDLKDVLQADICEYFEKAGQKLVVMANLPYNISSQVLVKLIHSRHCVKKAVLMFQKEMAQRITAAPGTKDYGRLSVMLSYCSDIKVIADIKSSLFFPRPKVDSTVVEILFHSSPDLPADNEAFLFSVIKAAFGKRRKTLKNALSRSSLGLDSATTQILLKAAGIDPVRRAETLMVSEFVTLSNIIGKSVAGASGAVLP